MKFKEKLNRKSKKEQFFILLLIYTAILGIFCITGCGGQSCEKYKHVSYDDIDVQRNLYSIPGCGGCLTSGYGCNLACWPQSCKVLKLSETDGSTENTMFACDVNYYGCSGCIGCGYEEKNCYGGRLKYEDINAFFYGSSESGEKIIGNIDGSFGCINSFGEMGIFLEEIENEL